MMLGTFCGAYLGARYKGLFYTNFNLLLGLYFLIKQSNPFRAFLIPAFVTIILGIGKYLMNYSYYSFPIPFNINSSNSLSMITFFENFKILANNILDRSWNYMVFCHFKLTLL